MMTLFAFWFIIIIILVFIQYFVYVYIYCWFYLWIVSMLILKHFEQFNLFFMTWQWNTFIFLWKMDVCFPFELNAWFWWNLSLISWVWASVYVRQRKNKNVNLKLELLVSRQIDYERKAWTKNRWECDLTLWVNNQLRVMIFAWISEF